MDAAGATDLRLREAGLRATRPRRLVLEALAGGGHRSADEVAAAVAGAGGRLSRQSVYNALDAFVGAGLVLAADVGSGPVRYELAGSEPHHHFVCRVCGDVLDVPGPPVSLTVPGAVVEGASVVLRGVCPRCAKG